MIFGVSERKSASTKLWGLGVKTGELNTLEHFLSISLSIYLSIYQSINLFISSYILLALIHIYLILTQKVNANPSHRFFFFISTFPPLSVFTKPDHDLLWTSFELFAGHSCWLMALIKCSTFDRFVGVCMQLACICYLCQFKH